VTTTRLVLEVIFGGCLSCTYSVAKLIPRLFNMSERALFMS